MIRIISFISKMNKCKGVTLQGKVCNRTCKDGIEFCGYHAKSKTIQINNQPIAVKQSITFTFYDPEGTIVEPHMLVKLQGRHKGSYIIDLNKILLQFDNRRTEIATILVIPNYIKNDLYQTLLSVDWDKKVLLRNKVVNRIGKYVISIHDEAQEPNYEQGQYRVLSYNELEDLKVVKNNVNKIVNQNNLLCKGDYNYNHEKLKLKYQGGKVNNMICIHLGDPIQLSYKWFFSNKAVSESTGFTLNHGDLYIMSEKATGHDYKLKKNPILKYGYF
jgi:hypothetical protein